jgi:nucleoside phosphorylase
MARDYVDILVVVPLDEEFEELLRVFPGTSNRSRAAEIRCSVDTGRPNISMLVVKQNGMGKTAAARATANSLSEYDAGIVISLGIAGSLSGDVRLGDVCYTGSVLDVTDNTKTVDADAGMDIQFSPVHYGTPTEITTALNSVRLLPEFLPDYGGWQSTQEQFARSIVDHAMTGLDDKEALFKPRAFSGAIICGAVSSSSTYNEKLKGLDRKIYAIETESGGVFEEAAVRELPALTIRGVSDYADAQKNVLETASKGAVRRIAAANAATFLKLQLSLTPFAAFLDRRRAAMAGRRRTEIEAEARSETVSQTLREIGHQVDAKLRELSPEFRLQPKGYRLPTPRVRRVNYAAALGDSMVSDPEEISEALSPSRCILINVPRTYPDQSLAWIIADALLTTELGGKQVMPIVIDGAAVSPAETSILGRVRWPNIQAIYDAMAVQIVFVVDDVKLASRTRSDFLVEQVKNFPDAKFIFTLRGDRNLVEESAFCSKVGADGFLVSHISFLQIAEFIQKNFNMSGPEAEVVALRLRDTFDKFELAAHPTYFAGIPREMLAALLQANRRAELIQLAVDGFLTFVVADDKSDIPLSRTARARFLRRLTVAMRLEKRTFSQEQLVSFVREFSTEHDFNIDPMQFVQSFVEKGILHFSSDEVRFSLPFIETYLFAAELRENADLANSYFKIQSPFFDFGAFDLYAEMGPSPEIVAHVLGQVDSVLSKLRADFAGTTNVMLTDEVRPSFLRRPGRIQGLQKRLTKAIEDVQQNKNDSAKKQRLLDMADRIRETAELETEKINERADGEGISDLLEVPLQSLYAGALLIGSGAEHLSAKSKRELAKLLVYLASQIMNVWTRAYAELDFDRLKNEVTKPEILDKFSEGRPDRERDETRKLLLSLVDVLEFVILSSPFRRTVDWLCEQARHKVLAASVAKAEIEGELERVVYGMWFADIDGQKGKEILEGAIKGLPTAPFLRVNISTHLLTRVYWNHWKITDRLTLLDAAEQVLRPLQMTILDKQSIKRFILSDDDDQRRAAKIEKKRRKRKLQKKRLKSKRRG